MKTVRRYGLEDLGPRIEAGHQIVREVIRQVPLLRIAGWDGPVMLGEFSFDGRTAGVAHLTPDYLPPRPGAVGGGGRVDTMTRLVTDDPSVLFPRDDHSRAPMVTPPPTGQLTVVVDEERLTVDAWYRRGDWVCSIKHGPYVTTVTGRGVLLEPLQLDALDDLEPLLIERRNAFQRWASSTY